MKKIVIHYADDIEDFRAVHLVTRHIAEGKLSDDGKRYCYVITTENEEICCDHLKSGTIKFCVNKKSSA